MPFLMRGYGIFCVAAKIFSAVPLTIFVGRFANGRIDGVKSEMDADLREIGKRLHTLRENKGVSRTAFGAIIGVNGRSVGRWERGEYIPEGRVQEIAKFYGVSADYIIYGAVKIGPDKKQGASEAKPFQAVKTTASNAEYAPEPLRERIINSITRLPPRRRGQALGYLQALCCMDIMDF